MEIKFKFIYFIALAFSTSVYGGSLDSSQFFESSSVISKLKMKTLSGSVSIKKEEQLKSIQIKYKELSEESRESCRVEVYESSNKVFFEISKKGFWTFFGENQCKYEVEVKVPSDLEIEINHVSGNVDIDGINGSQKIDLVSAHLQLNNLNGQVSVDSVSSEIKVSNVSGKIDINGISSKILIDRNSSDVQLRLSGVSVKNYTNLNTTTAKKDPVLSINLTGVSSSVNYK